MSVDELAELIEKEYDVSIEIAKRDVAAFEATLSSAGIVE